MNAQTPTRGNAKGWDVRSRPVAACTGGRLQPGEQVPVPPLTEKGSGAVLRLGTRPRRSPWPPLFVAAVLAWQAWGVLAAWGVW